MYLWRFFKKPEINSDDIGSELSILDKYPLYALTCDKKLAKRFQEERNMKKFIVQKTKVDKSEYAEFANNNRSEVLCLQKLTTVTNKYTKYEEIISVEVLLTTTEYQLCKEPWLPFTDDSWWCDLYVNMCNPIVFNKSLLSSLRYVDFNCCYKLFRLSGVSDEDDDYSAPDWIIDELAYFVVEFGHTLS